MVKTVTATLDSKTEVAPSILHLLYTINDGETLSFEAGQYALLVLEGAVRQFSLANESTKQGEIELLIELIENGLASTYFKKQKVGETSVFKGPAGIFKYRPGVKDRLYLATGTGIAPIRSIIRTELLNQKDTQSKHTLYWGLRKLEDIYLFEEWKELAEEFPNFDFKICLSRETSIDDTFSSHCLAGRSTSLIEEYVAQHKVKLDETEFYVCGGPNAVEGMLSQLITLGVDKKHIISERFR